MPCGGGPYGYGGRLLRDTGMDLLCDPGTDLFCDAVEAGPQAFCEDDMVKVVARCALGI